MPKFKLPAVSAVAAALASLTAAPAAVAGPWLAPWALGHLIGAAARLASLPIVAASVASSAGQPPPPVAPAPYGAGYAATPAGYAAAGYYAPPAYYVPQPAYYVPQPAYYVPPPAYYAPSLAYYRGVPRYYAASAYRSPAPYRGTVPLPEPFPRYSVAGMRYSGSYGGAVFSRSRGLTHRLR